MSVIIQRPDARHVKSFEEKNGMVYFTQVQINVIVNTALGLGWQNKQSTYDKVVRLIEQATDWQMRPTPLICRFAFKHGLARL